MKLLLIGKVKFWSLFINFSWRAVQCHLHFSFLSARRSWELQAAWRWWLLLSLFQCHPSLKSWCLLLIQHLLSFSWGTLRRVKHKEASIPQSLHEGCVVHLHLVAFFRSVNELSHRAKIDIKGLDIEIVTGQNLNVLHSHKTFLVHRFIRFGTAGTFGNRGIGFPDSHL